MTEYAERLLHRCDLLAQISALNDGILRTYLTDEHSRANHLVSEWMMQADMQNWIDPAGNVWGRYVSTNPSAKQLIIGSHLDTVPYAGRYDGILGVLAGIAVIESLKDNNVQLPFHLDVVGFGDEEGTRFGKTLLGSEAISGGWNKDWLTLQDEQGIAMQDAFVSMGLDPETVGDSVLNADEIIGYWELHIEQGPMLEQQQLPVGVVTGIAGAKRFNITVKGHAGHAGTVPMTLRQDATVGAAEMIQLIEQLAMEYDVVATVGQITVKPGGVNVIAGKAIFSLDIRSQHDELRDLVISEIQQGAQTIAKRRSLKVEFEQTHSAQAVLCDPEFMQVFALSCQQETQSDYHLVSGAGHDAMAVANLCRVAMLFMRCNKGISHHPDESVTLQDTAVALNVLLQAIMNFANKSGDKYANPCH